MRKLKFKQWDKELKKFHYWGYIEDQHTFISPPLVGSNPSYQYTGLKDKTGKEVYEGDVIHWKGYNMERPNNFEVVFYNGGFSGKKSKGAHYQLSILVCNSMHSVSGEVIGNIYENPELLNN